MGETNGQHDQTHQKKKDLCFFCIVILLSAAFVVWNICTNKNIERAAEQFDSVYRLVRDCDFSIGKFQGNKLSLYNKQGEVIAEYDNEQYSRQTKCLSLINDSPHHQMFFILGGAVDDTYGIVFTDNGTVCMYGLYTIERIGGNSFYYKTYR